MPKKILLPLLILSIGFSFLIPFQNIEAARIDELQKQIEDREKAISNLEKEIDTYQEDLISLSQEKQTLQNRLREIELSRKKLITDISAIQEKVDTKDLIIEQLSLEAQLKEELIVLHKDSLSSLIRSIDELDNKSLVESILSEGGIREAWEQIDEISSFQQNLQKSIDGLRELKKQIEENKEQQLVARKDLVSLRVELVDKRVIVDESRKEQVELIEVTKNEEAKYEALIQDRQALKEQFLQDLAQIESELKLAVDPSSAPDAQKGIFFWPVDNVRVTQYFGKTSDSGRLYASGTHNGVDFGVSVGTNIRTVLSGTIKATGDTGYPNSSCLSYGRWVLVEHPNGISTLYAHLSSVRVSSGQPVTTGDIIGYSGNTGYSTGPHLHLTAYLTEGVRVGRLGSFNGERATPCKDAILPVADSRAYLDPLAYLPAS